jgi:hypothetical protein
MGALLYLAFGSVFATLIDAVGKGSASQPEMISAVIGAFSGVSIGLTAFALVGILVVGCAVMTGVVDACLRIGRGEAASLSSCFSAGISKCLPVIGFYIIWYIGSLIVQYATGALFGLIVPQVALSFLSLIVSLLYYGVFAPSIPAIINETGVGPLSGFPRGLSLISGHYGMIVVTLLLAGLIYFIAVIVIVLVMAVLGGVLFAVNKYLLVLLAIPGLMIIVAISMFGYGSMASIYAELKLIKEGGDGKSIADVFS